MPRMASAKTTAAEGSSRSTMTEIRRSSSKRPRHYRWSKACGRGYSKGEEPSRQKFTKKVTNFFTRAFPLQPALLAGDAGGVDAVLGAELADRLGEVVAHRALGE